jgi:hypothetical protein
MERLIDRTSGKFRVGHFLIGALAHGSLSNYAGD